jgi:hypothetical protein
VIRPSVVRQIMRTTFSEFVRTPEALFWTYGFPLVMALVLGHLVPGEGEGPVHVGVAAGAEGRRSGQALQKEPRIVLEEVADGATSASRSRGPTSTSCCSARRPSRASGSTRRVPEADLARLLVEAALRRAALRDDPLRVSVQEEKQPGSRYIDFLIPGLIGLNLLGSGLWGLGYRIVEMRQKKLLKRLMTTPMGRAEFLIGFVASRMLLALPESLAIVLFGVLAFGVPCSARGWSAPR